MPTARELLEQADALMRRNRARQIDTEVPELTEAIPTPLMTPAPSPAVVLADIPELTDAVEEIEIASIVEIPDDDVEDGWLRSDDEELAADIVSPVATATTAAPHVPEPIGGRVLPLFAIAGRPHESAVAAPAPVAAVAAEEDPAIAAMTESPMAKAMVVELPMRDTAPAPGADAASSVPVAPSLDAARPDAIPAPDAAPGTDAGPTLDAGPAPDAGPTPDATPRPEPIPAQEAEQVSHAAAPHATPRPADDWARWEALAEEIRMQVLQRIDIFTDTGLREQLSVQMQPIVERASAEMVATINAQVGSLLRAYIAEAIEREIDKWRQGNH